MFCTVIFSEFLSTVLYLSQCVENNLLVSYGTDIGLTNPYQEIGLDQMSLASECSVGSCLNWLPLTNNWLAFPLLVQLGRYITHLIPMVTVPAQTGLLFC